MVPHSDMQSSSWILLKRDVRLKKIFFFFSPGKSCTSVHDWLHNFWQRRCLQNMRNSRRSKRGPTTLSDYNRHTDINTPCTQCLFTYLNTYKQEQTSFFFFWPVPLLSPSFKTKHDIFGAAKQNHLALFHTIFRQQDQRILHSALHLSPSTMPNIQNKEQQGRQCNARASF